jgi:hypothetical protein
VLFVRVITHVFAFSGSCQMIRLLGVVSYCIHKISGFGHMGVASAEGF